MPLIPANATTLHASCIALDGRALLILGASGSGKSALALQMIALGARLIADDRTSLWRVGDVVMAAAPPAILGQIEARGVGILGAPVAAPSPLALVVDMDQTEPMRLPEWRSHHVCGITLPELRKTDAAHFPAALVSYLRYGRRA